MLTRNGKCLCHLNNDNSRTTGSGNNTGFYQSNNGEYSPQNTNSFTQIMSSLHVEAGTGTTPASSTDYAITNPNAGLTAVSRSNTLGSNPNASQDYVGIFTTTYRNDTNADITVNEVGLVGNLQGVSVWYILAAREIIDPVTIAPGEAYTFTMYIG